MAKDSLKVQGDKLLLLKRSQEKKTEKKRKKCNTSEEISK